MARNLPRRRLATAVVALGFSALGVGAASAVPIGAVSTGAVSTGAVSIGSLARASHDTKVADSAEAWYAIPSGALCLPIVGCLPLPLPLPSTYPAGSLHVGATLGAESARTYIVPALKETSRLVATGGTLVLPVDTSPATGTLDFGSAQVKACLVTGKLPAGASAAAVTPGTPPAVDCKVSAPASFSRAGGYFYVDLSRFLTRWRHGTVNRGIALLPNLAGASKVATWQITILGHGSSGTAVHSLIAYSATATDGAQGQPVPSQTPSTEPSQPVPPAVTFPLPGTVTEVPPVSPPQVAPAATSAVYLIRSSKYRYPAIFLAPLAILAGVIFFGRLFTGQSVRPRTRARS